MVECWSTGIMGKRLGRSSKTFFTTEIHSNRIGRLINPNIEIRNSKQIPNPNSQMTKTSCIGKSHTLADKSECRNPKLETNAKSKCSNDKKQSQCTFQDFCTHTQVFRRIAPKMFMSSVASKAKSLLSFSF